MFLFPLPAAVNKTISPPWNFLVHHTFSESVFRNKKVSETFLVLKLPPFPSSFRSLSDVCQLHPKKNSLPSHFSLAPMLKVSSTTFVNQKDENWLWDGCAAMLISSQFPSSFTSILPATQAPAIINRSGKHIESICYSYSANSLSFIELS